MEWYINFKFVDIVHNSTLCIQGKTAVEGFSSLRIRTGIVNMVAYRLKACILKPKALATCL